jgi:hypothetical protein
MGTWLKKWIVNYNSSTEYGIDNATVQTCVEDILMCRLSTSENVIESMIKMAIANAYQ